MKINLKTKFIALATMSATCVLASHTIGTLATANDKFDEHIVPIVMVDVISIIIVLFVPWFAIRSIFRPQAEMIKAMHRIANGDTNVTIPHTKRRDEMGEMARTVQIFKENAQRVTQLADDQKRQQQLSEEQKHNAMQDLAKSFESNVKNVVDMVASAATGMDATARSVAHIAEGNQSKLASLTGQIRNTSTNVQTVAESTTQLSQAVSEITKQVSRASSITTSAVAEAEKADSTAQGLTDAAQKIGEVVEMINSIAGQINLLALNATIEAARAGEAGKGFAVVASEVKSLATQTTKATEQIAQYIGSIQSVTNETVGVIKHIGSTIHEINEIATAIATAVEEQGAMTADIAKNVQQAAQSTEEISVNATEVSNSSTETGESANQMMAATSELSRQSETLRHEVDKFLAGVRGE